jgi:hypothetical protein
MFSTGGTPGSSGKRSSARLFPSPSSKALASIVVSQHHHRNPMPSILTTAYGLHAGSTLGLQLVGTQALPKPLTSYNYQLLRSTYLSGISAMHD